MEQRWFTIGANVQNESGLDPRLHCNPLPLTALPEVIQFSTSVHSGGGFTIFSNKDLSELWATGNNMYGGCCVNSLEQHISQFRPILYFTRYGIKVRRIILNPMALAVFFISDRGHLYGAGQNKLLGTDGQEYCLREPIRIAQLHNVIDVASSGYTNTIALCVAEVDSAIIETIGKCCKSNDIPEVISSLICTFIAPTKVYHTEQSWTEGGWKEMHPPIPPGTSLVKVIMTGMGHVMFLDGDGILWEMQRISEQYVFGQMIWFSAQGIRIKDVKCGSAYVLALSEDGHVYSWGNNAVGECGNGTTNHVMASHKSGCPHRLQLQMADEEVEQIHCGWAHSSLITTKGDHYVFGNNLFGESVVFPFYERNIVDTPQCLTQGLLDMWKVERVIGVYPGMSNTKLLCEVQSAFRCS